jgi:hypothetical protein
MGKKRREDCSSLKVLGDITTKCVNFIWILILTPCQSPFLRLLEKCDLCCALDFSLEILLLLLDVIMI